MFEGWVSNKDLNPTERHGGFWVPDAGSVVCPQGGRTERLELQRRNPSENICTMCVQCHQTEDKNMMCLWAKTVLNLTSDSSGVFELLKVFV